MREGGRATTNKTLHYIIYSYDYYYDRVVEVALLITIYSKMVVLQHSLYNVLAFNDHKNNTLITLHSLCLSLTGFHNKNNLVLSRLCCLFLIYIITIIRLLYYFILDISCCSLNKFGDKFISSLFLFIKRTWKIKIINFSFHISYFFRFFLLLLLFFCSKAFASD